MSQQHAWRCPSDGAELLSGETGSGPVYGCPRCGTWYVEAKRLDIRQMLDMELEAASRTVEL